MSASFVSQLRVNRSPVKLEEPGAGTITLRIQAAELWNAVRVVAAPETAVEEVKQRAVRELFPDHESIGDFVLKLHGWEILDERASLKDSGVTEGSILLLTYRRRRPVR